MRLTEALRISRAGVHSGLGALMNESLEPLPQAEVDAERSSGEGNRDEQL